MCDIGLIYAHNQSNAPTLIKRSYPFVLPK